MKKLLLIINCILSIVIISSCGASKKNESTKITESAILEKAINDSINEMPKDTGQAQKTTIGESTQTAGSGGTKSDMQSTTSTGSSNTQSNTAPKNTNPTTINHNSDNQTKLDSIKSAKAKTKK